MIPMTRSLWIILFSLFTVNHVHGNWNWNNANVQCLKKKFDKYVTNMENIFSPGGELEEQSYILRMQAIELNSILDVHRSRSARHVVLNLCQSIKNSCPEVSRPMPLGDELYFAYVEVLGGRDENFVKACGEYVKKSTPEESYRKIIKVSSTRPGKAPSTSSGKAPSTSSGNPITKFFARKFGGTSSKAGKSSEDQS